MSFEIIPDSPLTFGSVLGRLFYTLKERPLLFFGLGALASAPGTVLDLAGAERAALFINLPAGLLIQGAIAVATFKTLFGQEVSFGEALSHSGGKLGACLLGALYLGLLSIIPFFLLLPIGLFSRAAIMLGMFFVVLPLIVVIIIPRSVMIQACVIEDLGPVESMKRSVELTRGFGLQIFGLFFVVGCLFFVALVLIIIGLSIIGSVVATAASASPDSIRHVLYVLHRYPLVITLLSLLFTVPITASFNVLTSIIYYDLRSEKEGLSLEALAGVFD